jgi:transcriptional regulator with XRE-family HTH domain
MRSGDGKRPADIAIGKVLKERREQRGWSQEQMAQKLGISRSMQQALEAGSCTLSFSLGIKVSLVLGVSITSLVPKGE